MGSNRTDNATKHQKSQFLVISSQVIPVFVKNIVLVAFGMAVGYPTILIPNLSDPNVKEIVHLDEEQISWIGSISMLVLPLGCSVSGLISQAIGRKLTMQVSSILMILCWLTLRFCNDVWQIYVTLVVFGFTEGLLESPVLTYVSEITEPRVRGSLLSTGPLAVTFGIFLEFLLGSIYRWRIVTYYNLVPPVGAFIGLFFVPESPCWLIMKNRIEDARKSLAWIRGWTTVDQIEPEFQEMLANNRSTNATSKYHEFKLSDYTEPQFIRPFVLLAYLFLIYNFTGLPTIAVYAVKLFETLEVPMNEYDATVVLGVAQFLGCLTCVIIIPFTGKRITAFFALVIIGISATTVATYAYLTDIKYMNFTESVKGTEREYSWIPLLFLLLNVFAINGGVRPIAWGILAEAFPAKTRAIATGSLGAVCYLYAFCSNKTFLDTISAITLPGMFWIYGGFGFVSIIVLYVFMPETEGRSLQEVTDHFSGKAKLGNTVRRKEKVIESKGVA